MRRISRLRRRLRRKKCEDHHSEGGPCHGRFRGGGHKLTESRRAVLDVLTGNAKHLSAEEIYMAAHKLHPAVGLATVYRTLELLVRMGLVAKFDFGDGRARYELAHGSDKEHHHHLVCTRCNRVTNYTEFIDDEIELLQKTEKGLSAKYNFEITHHIIQFYGVCRGCRD